MIKGQKIFILFMLLSMPSLLFGQMDSQKRFITVNFTPDHSDWTYDLNEDVVLTISVIKECISLKNIVVEYSWNGDNLPLSKYEKVNIGKSGNARIKLKGGSSAGFMTCWARVFVDGIKYSNYITVGFEPYKIEATTKMPVDFSEFWKSTLDESSKIPLNAKMILDSVSSTAKSNVYHVQFQNNCEGKYVHGVLSMPKAEGKYPAILFVPGAGIRAYPASTAISDRGYVVLSIGIHGIPVNKSSKYYTDLSAAGLNQYPTMGLDNRDTFYYKNVYTGCVKAVDFLCSLPSVNSDQLGVIGGSQGGALAIVTASLDSRIKYLVSRCPALSELAGYYNNRTGGWPHLFKAKSITDFTKQVKVSQYYDVVNFARGVKVPGFYTWGYNDRVCPPTTTFAMYNTLTAPKELVLARDCGHWFYAEQLNMAQNWLLEKLKAD